MNLQGFYTTKGLALAAKLAAGTALVITKVTAGAGETAVGASALAAEKQTLTVGSAQTTAQTAALPVTLAETKASASYSLTELGVYARDPDVGEILYQVFRLDEARAIAAGGGSVYRFYLKETVGAAGVTVSCSPSGLLIDEDLAPTRSKVLAAAAGSVSVSVTASGLQAYLDALPRLLTDRYTITVSGTYAGNITIEDFYGSGSITVQAASAGDCVLSGSVYVQNCAVKLSLKNLKWEAGAEYSRFAFLDVSAAHLDLENCTFLGYQSAKPTGVNVGAFGAVRLLNCTFQNLGGCLQCYIGGYAEVITTSDEAAFGDNAQGVSLFYGGVVLLAGSTPDTMGGSANSHSSGGLLVGANGKVI